ncbi:MAG: Na-translocating system protein MpsC family protein [Desulfitobacteriaceae bacterium]
MKHKSVLEKDLNKLITKLHREIFGKGPDEVWVKIYRNVGTFSCVKSLTSLEEFLLTTPHGVDEVLRLRKVIAANIKSRFCSEVEALCGVKVVSVTGELCIQTNTLYGVILFQDEIEDTLLQQGQKISDKSNRENPDF